jgi:hypothetical protein
MRSLGVLLVILGLGSLVLPMLGRQFTLLAPLDPYQPIAGIVVAAIGGLLIVGDLLRRPEPGEAVPPVASPAPGAGPTDTGDRSFSSPVPLGPASEPAAAPGTGTSAPPPVTAAETPAAAPAAAPAPSDGEPAASRPAWSSAESAPIESPRWPPAGAEPAPEAAPADTGDASAAPPPEPREPEPQDRA